MPIYFVVLTAIKCGPIAGCVGTTSRRVVYGLCSELDSEFSEFFWSRIHVFILIIFVYSVYV